MTEAVHKLAVQLTPVAAQALEHRDTPLVIELELFFSCLIRKRVLFRDRLDTSLPLLDCAHPQLQVAFRPVITRSCALTDSPQGPQLETLPVRNVEKFLPRWLRLDFRQGTWRGEFGYLPI